MSTHPTTPDAADDDDALADALADAWVEAAALNPYHRREALRAAGLLRQPETVEELSRQCGLSEGAIKHITRMGRARIAASLLSQPDMPAHLRRSLSRVLSDL